MRTKIPLKKKIALELFRKYKEKTTSLHELNYLFWECTLKCNLNCLHCGSDCKQNTTANDMPLSDFLGVIDNITPHVIPNKTTIVLTGGEPLLRNDLEICGNELYNRGYPWGIVSNGYLFDETKLNSLTDAGLRAVTISLDGLEEEHNWLRVKKDSYKRALNAINLLSRTSDLEYDVVTCVNQKNFNTLVDLKNLLVSIGAKEWRVFTIFPSGRAKNNKQLQLTPSQFRSLFEFIKEVRKEGSIMLSYGCEGFLGNYEGEVRDSFFFCRAGITIASVLADGSISACPSIREDFVQGNIYNQSFIDVWNNRFDIYRDRTWAKKGLCEDCEFFKYCNGNGMHLRDSKTGELSLCHLRKLEDHIY